MKITVIVTSELIWFTPSKQEKNIMILPENRTMCDVVRQLNIPVNEVSYVIHNGKMDDLNYKPQEGDTIELYPIIYSG